MKANPKYIFALSFLLALGLFSCKKDEGPETVTDVDGNVYKTVKIGDQIWMAENLRVTHYKDGSPIPYVSDNTIWSGLNTPAYCWYNNDEASNKNTYGALYNWFTVNAKGADNIPKLAPEGWHIPSDAEWQILADYLGNSDGGQLKETGSLYWNLPNTGATNKFAFGGRGGGFRAENGIYSNIKNYADFWTSTEESSQYSIYWDLSFDNAVLGNGAWYKQMGYSVRCIKD